MSERQDAPRPGGKRQDAPTREEMSKARTLLAGTSLAGALVAGMAAAPAATASTAGISTASTTSAAGTLTASPAAQRVQSFTHFFRPVPLGGRPRRERR
ncbi:hypothetical protein ACFQX6_35215 [Streptosporangium lutulentum]